MIVQCEQSRKKGPVIGGLLHCAERAWIGEVSRDIREVWEKWILDDCRDIVEVKAAVEVIRPRAQPGDHKEYQPGAKGKQKIPGLLF